MSEASKPCPPSRIVEALSRQATQRDDLSSLSFSDLEQVHAVVPELAALRTTVEDTSVVRVPSLEGRDTIWLKLESGNATDSVKARTAYALLCAAIVGSPKLRLIAYSCGSLAFALAEFSAALGFDLRVVIPHHAPESMCTRPSPTAGVRAVPSLPAINSVPLSSPLAAGRCPAMSPP